MINKKYNYYESSSSSEDVLDSMIEVLKVRPCEDILDSLGISHKEYRGGDVIRGKCPDHYIMTGRYPSGDTDWVVNVDNGMTFCHTEKRGSNLFWITKRLKNFATDEETLEYLLDGRDIKTKFERFLLGEKRRGFSFQNIIEKKKNRENEDRFKDEKLKFEKRIEHANKLIEKGFISDETIKFFENDGISYETIKKFNIVSFTDGFAKYRCLIPFFDYVNLNKLVGYVAVNTLSKHDYIFNIGKSYLKMQGITDWKNTKNVYKQFLDNYRKAIYLKGSLMREHLFGLNNLLKDNLLNGYVYLVEGERDAIKMQQEGFPCVGTHGSCISDEQLRILSELRVNKLYFIYDSDNAGREGAKKSIINAQSKGFRAFDICPNGKDPKKYNRNEMLELINSQVDETNNWSGLINLGVLNKNEKSKICR